MNIKAMVEKLVRLSKKDKCVFIEDFLKKQGLPCNRIQYRYDIENLEVPPKNPMAHTIVISAHYDISTKTKEGANDNVSSIAVLLHAAKALYEKNCTILFNDNEELLGGLESSGNDIQKIQSILFKTGSFLYLKNHPRRELIQHHLVLELCGIGDVVFLANKSSFYSTDINLIQKMEAIGRKKAMPQVVLPVPSTDFVAVQTFGISGTVLGAIPALQAKSYLLGKGKEGYPAIWYTIHTPRDTTFSIREESLQMCYRYLVQVVPELLSPAMNRGEGSTLRMCL